MDSVVETRETISRENGKKTQNFASVAITMILEENAIF